MKKAFTRRRRKKLILWTIAFSLVNIGLVISLFTGSKAQSTRHTPVKVRTETRDAPVSLSVLYVDSADPAVQTVVFNVRNNSGAGISGFVLQAIGENDPSQGAVVTLDLGTGPLRPGAEMTHSLALTSSSVERESSYVLFADFVSFDDGKTWGKDSAQTGQLIFASKQGRLAALDEVENRLKNGNTVDLEPPPPPPTVSSRSESWNRSYATAFKVTVQSLRQWVLQNPQLQLSVRIKELRERHVLDPRETK